MLAHLAERLPLQDAFKLCHCSRATRADADRMGLLARLAPAWERRRLARQVCRHVRAGSTVLRGFATHVAFLVTSDGCMLVKRHDACRGGKCARAPWCDGYCRTSDVPAPGGCLEEQLLSACAAVDFVPKTLVLGRQLRRAGVDPESAGDALLRLLTLLHPHAPRDVVEVVVERTVGGLGLMHMVSAVSTQTWARVQVGGGDNYYSA